ncbi:MAG: hypothetical protein ACRCSN_04040 [Dermatophilaceae bacterium]
MATGANAVASVACVAPYPYAIGGGANLAADVTNNELFGSYPTGGSTSSPATGWQARIVAGAAASNLTVYVVCSK